jgi:hypothetical protein
MAQVLICRLLTAEAQDRTQVSRDVGSVVGKVVQKQVLPPVLRLSLVIIILPLLHIHCLFIWGMDNGSVRGPVSHRHSLAPS